MARGILRGASRNDRRDAGLDAERGGYGIAVVVDHLDINGVEKVIARIRSEQGKLNILVNDISESAEYEFGQTFWNIDLERGFAMFRQNADSHAIHHGDKPGLRRLA